jgi:hypothetical protein
VLAIGATVIIYWSGTHLYIERISLASPSGPSDPAKPDPYGWQEEVFPWTGGREGGTSPELGWKGRMALRAAWMAMTWGVSDGVTLPWHHDVPLPKAIFELLPEFMLGRVEGFVDRRYEKAVEHVDEAIVEARKRDIKFPPTLRADRQVGPPGVWGEGVEFDPVGRDLLLIKAGVLERIGSVQATEQAKELYEQVLLASRSDGSPGQEATVMRLADRVGEMSSRLGKDKESLEWWSWGLKRAGIRIPKMPNPITTESWLGLGKGTTIQPDPTPISTFLIPQLAPPMQRARVTILASISSHFAATRQLSLASVTQKTALSLLPGTHDLPAPIRDDAPELLHDTWLQHRSANFALNHAEVLHALGDPSAQIVCTTAYERALNVWSALNPLPEPYNVEGVPWYSAAVALQRDAAALAAETSYTKGLLAELSKDYSPSEVTALYEAAMTINEMKTGRWDAETMNEDWQRYNKRFLLMKGIFGKRELMDEVEDGEDY